MNNPPDDKNDSEFNREKALKLKDADSMPGIIAELGELGASAIITEEGLAFLFGRHVASVKRAIARGELPQPCRLFGRNTWTVGVLIQHIEKRLERAAKEAEKKAKKFASLCP